MTTDTQGADSPIDGEGDALGRLVPVAPTVKLLLTLDEAAQALGIHKTFLYTRLLEPDHIFSIKLGSRRLVPVHVLHEYVEHLIAQQKAS